MNEIFTTIKDRVKSPIVGPFIASFVLMNWEAVSVFFLSKLEVVERIVLIKSQYLSLQSALAYPLMATLAYILVIPWLSYFVALYNMNIESKRSRNALWSESNLEMAKIKTESRLNRERLSTSIFDKREELEALDHKIKLTSEELVRIDSLKGIEKKLQDAKATLALPEDELRKLLTNDDKDRLRQILALLDSWGEPEPAEHIGRRSRLPVQYSEQEG
jgi:hypothetical protein